MEGFEDYSRRDAQNDFLTEVVYASLIGDFSRAWKYLSSPEYRHFIASETSGLSYALEDMDDGYVSARPEELISHQIKLAKLMREL